MIIIIISLLFMLINKVVINAFLVPNFKFVVDWSSRLIIAQWAQDTETTLLSVN